MTAYAHSGRTDSNGGHKDNKNASGLGYYHYHCGGHPAHLHEEGICQYDPIDTIALLSYPETLVVGESESFNYNIISVKNNGGTVRSSNEDIISVKANNKLVAIKEGTATITINSYNNKSSFSITVVSIAAESLILSEKSIRLKLGESEKIDVDIKPVNTTDKSIKWESSDLNVATVSSGLIKSVGTGKATISATTSNNITKTIEISVYEEVKVEETEKIIETGNSIEETEKIIEYSNSIDETDELLNSEKDNSDNSSIGDNVGIYAIITVILLFILLKYKKVL